MAIASLNSAVCTDLSFTDSHQSMEHYRLEHYWGSMSGCELLFILQFEPGKCYIMSWYRVHLQPRDYMMNFFLN